MIFYIVKTVPLFMVLRSIKKIFLMKINRINQLGFRT